MPGLDETGSLEPLRNIPTLVLTGDEDKLFPKVHSDLIMERLEGSAAELVVVPEAGHMVLLEKPAEVTEALSTLLRKAGAGAPARR